MSLTLTYRFEEFICEETEQIWTPVSIKQLSIRLKGPPMTVFRHLCTPGIPTMIWWFDDIFPTLLFLFTKATVHHEDYIRLKILLIWERKWLYWAQAGKFVYIQCSAVCLVSHMVEELYSLKDCDRKDFLQLSLRQQSSPSLLEKVLRCLSRRRWRGLSGLSVINNSLFNC